MTPFHKVQVLLHLHMDLLGLLLELINNLSEPSIVCVLLLLLLALRTIGNANITVIIDFLLKLLRLACHFLRLLRYLLSVLIVVSLRSDVLFLCMAMAMAEGEKNGGEYQWGVTYQLNHLAQIILELCKLTFDLHVGRAESIR